MFNLVWKDLLIIKRFLWYAPVYGLIMVFALSNMNGGAIISGVTVGISYVLMLQACAQDDKNKSEIMLNCLPLYRRDIVLAKYLSIFFYAALGILSVFLGQSVVSVTGIPVHISKISLEGIASALIATIGLISIYYPVYFKLGYLRSNIVGMIMFFAAFFVFPLLGSLIRRVMMGIPYPALQAILRGLEGWLQTQADWQIASYLVLLALTIMLASFRLSLRFYTKREF